MPSFLGVLFYFETTDPLVSKAIDVLYGKTATPRHCGWQSVWAVPTGDEESREEDDDAKDSEDGGVEYEDVAHLQPSDGK